MTGQQLIVGLGERSYPIFIGSGLLVDIGKDLQQRKVGKRYAIISDDTVSRLYGSALQASLKQSGMESSLIVFPAGESSKNMETMATLASELAERGFDRTDALIALGGGVSGDITGFLASIYMRGIPFVQVPTSLLAQVDSSVGGKTGVDIPQGKNLVGTFYQPRAVYIDTDVLNTLPPDELRGGLAEVIKYGAAMDEEFFRFLQVNRDAIVGLEPGVIAETIKKCCETKAMVVEQDEREGGIRRILNFGHTIGHAVESASDFKLIHGFAVAIGMCAVAELAVLGGKTNRQVADSIRRILKEYDLPVAIPEDLDREAIKSYLQTDKKTIGGRVFFVLPEAIGKVVITDDVDERDIDAVLEHV